MSRRSGVRKRALGVAIAAACAGGAIALGFSGMEASAAGASFGAELTTNGVSSSAGSGSVVQINQGDSVIFSAGTPPSRVKAVPGYAVTLNPSSFSGGSVRLAGKQTYRATFANAGSYPFSWTPSNLLGRVYLSNGEYTTATVVVIAPSSSPTPPPTSPADPPPGSSPGGPSPSAGFTGAVPRSLGNLTSAPSSSIHGFAPPPSDTASGTGTASASHAAGTSAGGAANTDSAGGATPGPVSRTTLYADVAIKKTRPVGLAIICILALAAVTGFAAYQRLGRSALNSARRRYLRPRR